MLQLVAINENAAAYVRNEAMPDVRLDGFKYLNGLLRIRSASGLVEFLRDFPHLLRPSYNPAELPLIMKSANAAEGHLKFSQAAMLNAAESCNVEYFDAMMDVELPSAKLGPTWGREADIYILYIKDLEDLAERLGALLLMAAASYGERACEDAFVFDNGADGPIEIGGRAYATRLWVQQRAVAAMLPGEDYSFFKAYKISDGYAGKDDGAPALLIYDGFGDRVEFVSTLSKEEAVMEAAGVITAYALSAWLNRIGAVERVTYSGDGGFDRRDVEVGFVADALTRAVMERRVGVCQYCGKPFVSKKVLTGGGTDKRFCTDSCKVAEKRS